MYYTTAGHSGSDIFVEVSIINLIMENKTVSISVQKLTDEIYCGNSLNTVKLEKQLQAYYICISE